MVEAIDRGGIRVEALWDEEHMGELGQVIWVIRLSNEKSIKI